MKGESQDTINTCLYNSFQGRRSSIVERLNTNQQMECSNPPACSNQILGCTFGCPEQATEGVFCKAASTV
jgi:hypothetical protein